MIFVRLKKLWHKLSPNPSPKESFEDFSPKNESFDPAEITSNLDNNLETLLKTFKNSSDFSIKRFYIEKNKEEPLAILYLDTLVDTITLNKNILEPLMHKSMKYSSSNKQSIIDFLDKSCITVSDVIQTKEMQEIITGILLGKVILLLHNHSEVLIIDCKKSMERDIEEPLLESVSRGARDGFTESVHTNISLVRQRLKDPFLKVRKLVIGERTQTEVCVLYIEDIVNSSLVKNVIQKLSSIQTDGILSDGYLEEYLEENPYSPFPQVDNTERPDKVVASLLEGRVAILVDGSPSTLVVPIFLIQLFQSPEDYYQRTLYAGMLRLLRYLSAFISVSFPAIYLSLLTYHSQFIPSTLIELLLTGRSELPFPAALEILILLFQVDLIQEASSRLLGRVGQAAGIVGSIVLGQAAIVANITSPSTVVVIATTFLSSYVVPRYALSFSLRILRYLMIFAASFLGIYGVIMAWLIIIIHLCSIESMGTPYLAPISPTKIQSLKDSIVRFPIKKMVNRPSELNPKKLVRKGESIHGTRKK
jgi:hypothetical protein